ncbi:hypothetical protein J6590_052412 [Homalodisca vitripennis]|nr:hypothetical protein J6590_052412 [Homalodisca vitripennis]
MLTIFGILTLTSWAVRISNSSGRQLVTWWCVFVMLLTASYSSSIAARLTLPKYEPRIDTVQQLVEQGFNWYDQHYPTSDKWSIYFNPTNDWQNKFKLRFKPLTEAQVLPALTSRKFAFPIQKWGGLFMYFNAEGLEYERDLVDMRVMKETTDATYVSLGFAKNSPFFRVFQGPLMRMYQAGLMAHWTSEVVRTKVDNYAKRLLQETDDVSTQSLRKLKMDNLLPAFYILGFGLFNSTLLLLAEIWYFKSKKKNPEPNHPFVL